MIMPDRMLAVTVYIYWASLRVHGQLLVGKGLREGGSVLNQHDLGGIVRKAWWHGQSIVREQHLEMACTLGFLSLLGLEKDSSFITLH